MSDEWLQVLPHEVVEGDELWAFDEDCEVLGVQNDLIGPNMIPAKRFMLSGGTREWVREQRKCVLVRKDTHQRLEAEALAANDEVGF